MLQTLTPLSLWIIERTSFSCFECLTLKTSYAVKHALQKVHPSKPHHYPSGCQIMILLIQPWLLTDWKKKKKLCSVEFKTTWMVTARLPWFWCKHLNLRSVSLLEYACVVCDRKVTLFVQCDTFSHGNILLVGNINYPKLFFCFCSHTDRQMLLLSKSKTFIWALRVKMSHL